MSQYNNYLQNVVDSNSSVSIYLINGIKLSGYISGFDNESILLVDNKNTVNQLILKQAISTIVPAK